MTNEDINKKVESVVNSIEFIEDEDYKYLHKYSVEIEIKKCIEEIETLCTQLAKANERVAKLERENTNGNAAAELLIWWAKKLSNAPNEDLKEVIRIGYKRIVNLANLIGEEQLRKEQNND